MSALNKMGAFAAAALISAGIVSYGQGLWQVLVIANLRNGPQIPWCAPVMAGLLVMLLLYLSGRGWPKATSATRRRLLRWNPIPWPSFFMALLAGVLAMAAFGGLWIVVSDLIHIPAGVQPKMRGVPLMTAVVLLLTSAAAAPLSEEAAFRGYAMGILERASGNAPAAILGSTILFAAVHVLQGLDAAKLGLYFTAGLVFAVIAYLTNSLYAVMIVHGLGDIMGFTLLWPHDARPHAMGFADPWFGPALLDLLVCAALAWLAFRKLARISAPLRPPPAS